MCDLAFNQVGYLDGHDGVVVFICEGGDGGAAETLDCGRCLGEPGFGDSEVFGAVGIAGCESWRDWLKRRGWWRTAYDAVECGEGLQVSG